MKAPVVPEKAQARLANFRDGFLYASSGAVERATRRHPAVVLFSLDAKPLRVVTDYQNVTGSVLVVAPQIRRTFYAENQPFVSLHIEPSHAQFLGFVPRSAKEGVRKLARARFAVQLRRLQELHSDGGDLNNAQDIFDLLLTELSLDYQPNVHRDSRIDWVLHQLSQQSPLEYDFDDLVKNVSLSPGRLSHLFKTEAGLSLRSFMTWRKIKEALHLVYDDLSLTDVAHRCGFSDSAHFSRTFSSSLGLSPSQLRDDRCIQVVSDPG